MKPNTFVAFLAGMAAGATALFLTNEENRKRAKAEIERIAEDPRAALDEGVEAVTKQSKQLADKTTQAVNEVVDSGKAKINKATKPSSTKKKSK